MSKQGITFPGDNEISPSMHLASTFASFFISFCGQLKIIFAPC